MVISAHHLESLPRLGVAVSVSGCTEFESRGDRSLDMRAKPRCSTTLIAVNSEVSSREQGGGVDSQIIVSRVGVNGRLMILAWVSRPPTLVLTCTQLSLVQVTSPVS